VPASLSLLDDRAFVHINAGWQRTTDSGNRLLWGIGG
jgi:hypothetical protein